MDRKARERRAQAPATVRKRSGSTRSRGSAAAPPPRLFEHYPDGLLIVDRTGIIRRANRRAAGLFGYSGRTLIGKPVESLVPDASGDRHRADRTTYWKAPRGREMGADLPLLARRRDGSEFPVDVMLSPLPGRMGVLAAVRDITARRDAEAALREASDLLERRVTQRTRDLDEANRALKAEVRERERTARELDAFFDLALDLFGVVGTDGYLKRVNAAWTTQLGHTVEALLSRPYLEFFHPDDRAATAEEAVRLGRGIDTTAFEWRCRHRDGSFHWLRWKARLDPATQRIHAVGRDISDAKRASTRLADLTEGLRVARDAAESAERLKSTFLATMSHELRTPLNSILGFTGVLLGDAGGPLTDEQRRQLRIVEASASHLKALIDDVLDVSRLEAGRLEPVFASMDISATVAAVVGTLRPQAAAKDLTLTVDMPRDVPDLISDPRRVRQILINLVGNAIKFTERGSVTVAGAVETDHVRVDVIDTGPGLAKAQVERLFEPFVRAERQAGQAEGTGLGLAIVRGLATILGGSVDVDTEPGRGSTFTVRLPVHPPGAEAQP